MSSLKWGLRCEPSFVAFKICDLNCPWLVVWLSPKKLREIELNFLGHKVRDIKKWNQLF